MPEDYNRTMVTRELVSLIHKKRNEGFSLPLIPQEEENKQNAMNFSNTSTAISAFSVMFFFNGTIEGPPTFFCVLRYQYSRPFFLSRKCQRNSENVWKLSRLKIINKRDNCYSLYCSLDIPRITPLDRNVFFQIWFYHACPKVPALLMADEAGHSAC